MKDIIIAGIAVEWDDESEIYNEYNKSIARS